MSIYSRRCRIYTFSAPVLGIVVKKVFPDLLIWWDIGKCKVNQITQEYCITRPNNIIHICESLRKDIDALAQKANVNPEMAAIYDEKCKQLKGIIDDKLRGSCIRAWFLYVNEIDTSSKYFFNKEKQKATSKQLTHLKLADNSVTEDEQVIRQMTIAYYRTLFTAETVVYDTIDMF